MQWTPEKIKELASNLVALLNEANAIYVIVRYPLGPRKRRIASLKAYIHRFETVLIEKFL